MTDEPRISALRMANSRVKNTLAQKYASSNHLNPDNVVALRYIRFAEHQFPHKQSNSITDTNHEYMPRFNTGSSQRSPITLLKQ